ncbi:PAQR family membrane homeostasis protein TrhA [Jatrophihabitans lederbergiae]|uniref:Hemolysin III family protein n=1 Tax=Jatrophihabitans lederbergiae TaxID=3075547 RepID=A0ABU2JA30_9ACTN|nr:hemolysin III family protein [Jatrophihabitans sp. DSM 44399]MDT0261836.1 hemolysin III family protein [Jatrophihabitans sp. DSM 44399]
MTSLSPASQESPLAVLASELKPRARGWLHTYAALISVVTGITLVAVAAASRGERAALPTTIYAVTVTLLFGTSAMYHRRAWGPRGRALMKRLDHSMIFVFIAGSYTPFAALTLPRASSEAVLVVVWTGAVFGVLLKTAWPDAPRLLSVPLYIALGWVAVFVLPELLHNYGVATLVLIAAGGLIYTLGALAYGFKKPNPYPGTFGFHEVFHLCTLVAASCHYVAVWLAVFA